MATISSMTPEPTEPTEPAEPVPTLAARIAQRRTELRAELERIAVAAERLRGAVAILEELAQDPAD